MTDHHEIKRLADGGGGGPELSASIALARREGPSAEQRARLRAKLGLPAEAPAPEPPVAGGATSAVLAKVGLSAVILAIAGAAFWTWLAREPAPRAPIDAAAPRAELALPRPPLAVVATPAAPEQAPRAQAPAPARPPPREAKRASAPASEPPAPDVTAELTLLRRARSHVRSAPARALALVAEHEQQFARGALVEEREVIAIEALLLAGERAAGQARAAAFIARFPSSAHVRRVRVLLDEHGVSDQGTRVPATPSR